MNYKKVWICSILLLLSTFLLSTLVLANGGTDTEDWLTGSKFYEIVSPYIVPSGMEGLSGLIIGIVTIVILFVVFLDILSLIPVFSETTMKVIAVGVGIIAVVFKLNITFAGWLFAIGASIFAWAGAASVFLTIILAVLVLVAILFGGDYITNWLKNIRSRREGFEKEFKAKSKGQDIHSLAEMAKVATK